MTSSLAHHIALCKEHIGTDYRGMFREEGNPFPYPFLTPGSASYGDVLWDWDSWLSNVALRQALNDMADPMALREAVPYERGCILNALAWCDANGWIPIMVARGDDPLARRPPDIYHENMHKPCLAQHAAFLADEAGGDAEWLRESFSRLQGFVNCYRNHHRHACGLYYWQTDFAVGVDNDPCIYYRPPASCGSIYLNCLMYRELLATAYLCDCLNLDEVGLQYRRDADDLKTAVLEHCWDERDGFFYNVDLNLVPIDNRQWLHVNQPRDWPCLIMRIGVWSGFMALWAGIASPDQAERVVREHYQNEKTFNAPFGVRSLSKMERMYNLRASGNPSSWLGPIWGIANYMTFRGLVSYGFEPEARQLAEKTIHLFGRDFERFGALHEYYQPENGEPILNRGFQNWNYLVLNMIAWLEGRETVSEF